MKPTRLRPSAFALVRGLITSVEYKSSISSRLPLSKRFNHSTEHSITGVVPIAIINS